MRSELATATSRDQTQGCGWLTSLPVTYTTSRQLASSRPPFSQSGVPCSFLRASESERTRASDIFLSHKCCCLAFPAHHDSGSMDCPRDSGQLQPANHHVPCFILVLPCRRVRRRGEQDRSVMARGNLDFSHGRVGVLGIGRRGLFSRHLLNAHRFEFLLESLAPPSRATC